MSPTHSRFKNLSQVAKVFAADTPLRGLTHIGPTIAERLATIGVSTVGDLQRVGVAQAFQKVRAAHPDVTIPVCYYLYSLEGTLRGTHGNALPEASKSRLRAAAGLTNT